MPSYAILGATGATGQSLLNILTRSPKNDIHAYVRSKAKLERLQPQVSKLANVRVFEGNLQDIPMIASCISGVSALFSVVATNDSVPGLSIAQDTAHTLVAAFCYLRSQDPTVKLPKTIFLSSSSVDPYLVRHQPAIVHWMIYNAFYYNYIDLEKAESYLRLHRSWLSATFIQPGGIVEDAQKGHALDLEREKTFISYLDLAAGMIEVADAGEKYDWTGVSVVPTAKDVKIRWMVPWDIMVGLLWHYLPWLYWIFH